MQFQIHRLVKIWVHVTADVCHAQWPDKPRMVSHYKINMLIHIFLLVHTYTLFACIWSRHLKLYLRE